MSDVVRGTFGRKDKPASRFDLDAVIAAAGGGEPEPDRAEFERRFPCASPTNDSIYINEHPSEMELTVEQIDTMCMHFYTAMRYVPNMPLVTGWRELMQRISMEEVCAEIRASNRADWKYKPSYYTALVMEFYGRTSAMLQLLSM